MFEAYRIGVTIALKDHLSTAIKSTIVNLMSARRHVGALQGSILALESAQRRLGRTGVGAGAIATQLTAQRAALAAVRSNRMNAAILAGGGMASMAIGGAIFGGLVDSSKWGREFYNRIAQMRAAGMTQQELAEATQVAWQTTGTVLTTTVEKNLAALLDLRSVLGSFKEAKGFLPIVQQAQMVMEASGYGGNTRDQVFDMVKALDMINKTTDKDVFKRNIEKMLQVSAATGNRITPETLRMTFKWARQARLNWSEDFIYQILPTFLMDQLNRTGGGSGQGGMGAPLASVSKTLVDGIMTKRMGENLQKYGLIDKNAKFTKTTTKDTQITAAFDKGQELFKISGGIWNRDLLASNAYEWVQQLIKKFETEFNKGVTLTEPERRALITNLFPGMANTGKSALMDFAVSQERVERDRRILLGTGSLADMTAAAQSAPDNVFKALEAQIENVKTAWGVNVLPPVLDILRQLAPVIGNLARGLAENPEGVAATAKSLLVISGLLVAGGAIATGFAILGAAFSAPVFTTLAGIAAGITAVGAAIAGLYGAYRLFSGAPEAPYEKPTAVHWGANSSLNGIGDLAAPPTKQGARPIKITMNGRNVGHGVLREFMNAHNSARSGSSGYSRRQGVGIPLSGSW